MCRPQDRVGAGGPAGEAPASRAYDSTVQQGPHRRQAATCMEERWPTVRPWARHSTQSILHTVHNMARGPGEMAGALVTSESPRSHPTAGPTQAWRAPNAGRWCCDWPTAGPAGPRSGPARTGISTRDAAGERKKETERATVKTDGSQQRVGQGCAYVAGRAENWRDKRQFLSGCRNRWWRELRQVLVKPIKKNQIKQGGTTALALQY